MGFLEERIIALENKVKELEQRLEGVNTCLNHINMDLMPFRPIGPVPHYQEPQIRPLTKEEQNEIFCRLFKPLVVS